MSKHDASENPLEGQRGTRLDASWFGSTQEEMATYIARVAWRPFRPLAKPERNQPLKGRRAPT